MEKNQNDPRNQEKSGNPSNQKSVEELNKKETNPDYPTANRSKEQNPQESNQQRHDSTLPPAITNANGQIIQEKNEEGRTDQKSGVRTPEGSTFTNKESKTESRDTTKTNR